MSEETRVTTELLREWALPEPGSDKESRGVVLVVGGSEDPFVPRAMTESFYASARAPKELYLIEGAGHGHYTETAGPEYFARLVTFFDAALRPHEMVVSRHVP